MRPPIPIASSDLFVDDLRGEISQLRRVLSFWLTAALVSSGIVGVGILCSGVVVGAELHKSGFVVGGLLAVLCLIQFAALQEAWGTIVLLLSLLEFDDAISREDILKKLTDFMQKHTSAKRAKSAVVPENIDFDEATLEAMEGLPVRLLGAVTSALQAGPAAVSVASAVCAMIIFLLHDVPDQVAALPIAFASLAILGSMCGFHVRIRAATVIRKIAYQQMDFDSAKQSPGVAGRLHHAHQFSPCPGLDLPLRATLLELYVNMLRRKLAATAQGCQQLGSFHPAQDMKPRAAAGAEACARRASAVGRWRATHQSEPAMPTAIWQSQLKSGSAHCDLAVAAGAGEEEGQEEEKKEEEEEEQEEAGMAGLELGVLHGERVGGFLRVLLVGSLGPHRMAPHGFVNIILLHSTSGTGP
eukprot:s1055_g3.t1